MTMRQAWNRSWDVNVTGGQVMTATFVPLLLRSQDPRLLFVASGMSSLAWTENAALPINAVPARVWPKTVAHLGSLSAYRSSKTGMNMMMRSVTCLKRKLAWC